MSKLSKFIVKLPLPFLLCLIKTSAPKVSDRSLSSFLVFGSFGGTSCFSGPSCFFPPTRASVCLTDKDFLITSVASPSCFVESAERSARACPISILPSSSKTCTSGARFKRRNRFVTADLDYPTALPRASCERLNSC